MSLSWLDRLKSFFSRGQAENGLNKATTAALQSALTNYINATKNMNANAIRAALNIKMGPLAKNNYKNRIANAVANAVIKARKANNAMKAAKLGAIPETAAAAAVQTATNAVNNMNKLSKPVDVTSQIAPKGLGGALFGVKRGNNQNNSTNNVNRNYVLAILKNNAKYQNNRSKINAIVAYNPGLNFSKLARNNNNAKIKNLLAQANSIKKFKQGPAQRLNNTLKAAGNNNNTLTGNMFKQANNAANKAKKNALQQGKTEQNANKKAAEAAAQTAVANAPPSANANAVRQAAKAATLAAGATPAAANNASKMVTQKLNEPIEEIQGGPRNNAYGNNKRTNKSRAMNTSALVLKLGSRGMNARSPAYIAEALARLKNNSSSANNKASLVEILARARNNYKVPLVIPQVN